MLSIDSIMDLLLFLLQIVFCFLISSSIHELGHILVGIKEGFKFYLFIVGPFGFKRNEDGKVIFYIEKNITLWGGVGATIPSVEDVDNYKKFGHVLLGGPITSIAFGVISLPLAIITANSFLLLLGVLPISMGIACLIPSRNGAFYSDGGRWLRMHKEDTKAVEMAIWSITQSSVIQNGSRKVNFNDIRLLINNEDIRTRYLGHYYAYCFYRDSNDTLNMEKEKGQLELLKEKVPKQVVSMFSLTE
jgi:hypothetical protein